MRLQVIYQHLLVVLGTYSIGYILVSKYDQEKKKKSNPNGLIQG